MVVSMTGFGRGELKKNGVEVTVEIRTLNHRFLDLSLRIPKVLSSYELDIKELIRSHLSRGRVEASINLKSESEEVSGMVIDRPLATTYIRLLREIKEEFGLPDPLQLGHLLNFPDIITVEAEKQPNGEIWDGVKVALERSLEDLTEMRVREGREIKKDLSKRIKIIGTIIGKVEKKSKNRSRIEYDKLHERIKQFAQFEKIDEGRLEAEIALLADRIDVTEECIRFKSHNAYFLELLDNKEIAGRKLNFLLQEMHREANTIGSKSNDSSIAHWVVEIKEEVEKLREQIQNIE